MSRNGRFVTLGLACAVAMVPGAEGAVPWSKGATTRKVTLSVQGMGCGHEIEAKPVKLEKKKKDAAIGWRIRNECNIQRKVVVCTYDAAGKRANPFGACASVPPGLALETAFTLAATGGSAEIDCPAEQEGRYTAIVLVGDPAKGAACPPTPPKERLLAAGEDTPKHLLVIDIVP